MRSWSISGKYKGYRGERHSDYERFLRKVVGRDCYPSCTYDGQYRTIFWIFVSESLAKEALECLREAPGMRKVEMREHSLRKENK